MQISRDTRWLLLLVLLASTCVLVTYGKGGRGGGSRGGGSRTAGSRSRSSSSTRYRATSRPAPAPTSRPAAPTYKPAPTYRPASASARPPSAASPKPSAPNEPVVVKQPAQNPNFKETNPNQGASNNQPASNPNYRPDGSAPGGPPPPYSPAGQPAPSAPVGPPPAYGSQGQRPPYPPGGQVPPPYPGNPGYPPAYPGLPNRPGQPAGYPNQPGGYPNQPGGYPNQPGGYPNQPGVNRPYPVQPGSYPNQQGGYPNQPGVNRPYPVQPGSYPGGYPGGNRPYPVQPGYAGGGYRPQPQQPLGGNVWHPQSGMPSPAYMNHGGLPTGANMYSKPHKQKGFLGSLMSMGGSKPKKNKYYGSYPSPYGVGHMGGGGFGHGGGMGKMGSFGKSAAMYTILPYMAMKGGSRLFSRPSFGYMPYFMMMPHFHHGHYGHYGHYENGMYPGHTHYYDMTSNEYAGKCQQPLRRENSDMKCKSNYKEIECQSKCQDGYKFANQLEVQTTKCWHVTGVWRPFKNFPTCNPICDEECENGGICIRPGVCGCMAEYRGDRCQFHFLNCDARHLLKKGETKVGWVCNHTKNETTCQIHCKEPEVFETPSTHEFKCTPEGKWTPDSVPRCVVKGAENS